MTTLTRPAPISKTSSTAVGRGEDIDWIRESYEAETREEFFVDNALPLLDLLARDARRLIRDPGRADDLVSDTLLRAYVNLGRFKKGTNFKAWLFRIQRNLFVNAYRSEQRRTTTPIDTLEVASPGDRSAADFVGTLTQALAQVGDELKSALARLPARFRVVFLLAALGDYEYKEIARFLAIPVGTVMSRLFRARESLAADLADYYRSGEWTVSARSA